MICFNVVSSHIPTQGRTVTTDTPPRGPSPRPGPPNGPRQVLLSVKSVRHSQTTVNSPTRLFGIHVSLHELVAIYRHNGYLGEPIAVVPMPDERLTSLDNRRLWAVRKAGLQEIPAIIHDPDAPWGTFEQRDFLRRRSPLVDHAGEVGPPGRILLNTNEFPTTHSMAVLARCGRQIRPDGERVPLLGVEGDARIGRVRQFRRSVADDRRILRWSGQNGTEQDPPPGPTDPPAPRRGPRGPQPPGRGPVER